MNNNFILERYRPGGANRFVCPNCGKKKCFTRYVDVSTGEYVGETCGKCDHESSCGYHYPPREYYRDHPESVRPQETYTVNGKRTVLSHRMRTLACVPTAAVQTEFYDIGWAVKAAERASTFRSWFEGLPFAPDLIKQVLADYYVGATQRDIICSGINYGPAAIFWMIDEQQRVHDAKLIAYTSDGHRVQSWGNSMRSICVKANKGPQLEQTEKVLFGLHLVPRYPEKTICIVESEKSALVCALRYPEHLWLATGGCGNLQVEKLRPLLNRRLIVYPDAGECDKWRERMAESGHANYTVMDFIERYESNTDIADVILGEAKLRNPKNDA